MDAVIRGVFIYLFIVLVFRLAGRRTMSDITTYDFILILIVAETTQQALLGEDFSLTNAAILIVVLVMVDIGLSYLKHWLPWVDKWLEGKPIVIVENGAPLKERMNKERVSVEDVMQAARQLQGLERLEQIKYAVLEKNGGITVIPRSQS